MEECALKTQVGAEENRTTKEVDRRTWFNIPRGRTNGWRCLKLLNGQYRFAGTKDRCEIDHVVLSCFQLSLLLDGVSPKGNDGNASTWASHTFHFTSFVVSLRSQTYSWSLPRCIPTSRPSHWGLHPHLTSARS
jgi:hypothetical protein